VFGVPGSGSVRSTSSSMRGKGSKESLALIFSGSLDDFLEGVAFWRRNMLHVVGQCGANEVCKLLSQHPGSLPGRLLERRFDPDVTPTCSG
jgi:hypothetical protein